MSELGVASATEQPDISVLIQRCLGGDQSSYSLLYDHFAQGVYRLCYSLLLNRQDAEDVTQDAFVYAFKNLGHYDVAKSAFKTWLYTIAVSRCRNQYRRKGFSLFDITQIFHFNLVSPRAESPEAQVMHQDMKTLVQTALGELSPRLREAVVLRYGHGLTYREIADIMGIPAKTAESRVRLAHEQLRSRLHAEGRGLLEELLQL
jgi:RNA polymerase sigma-70 factor, ECF subfamily